LARKPVVRDELMDLQAAFADADALERAASFVRESNRIEGIHRDPTREEVQEHVRFVNLSRVSERDLQRFVSVYQPGKMLRTESGMDVRVGSHIAPPGGPDILPALRGILARTWDARVGNRALVAYETHVAYETLHPFMDGNGRSGRALWAWCMQRYPLSFLHHWYYQTLQFAQTRSNQ
jgi:hypothetical protein